MKRYYHLFKCIDGQFVLWDHKKVFAPKSLYYLSVADLHTKVSGARPPPQQDQILLFLHMFSPKSTCVGGWRPLQRGLTHPPTGNPGSAPVYVIYFTSGSVPQYGIRFL